MKHDYSTEFTLVEVPLKYPFTLETYFLFLRYQHWECSIDVQKSSIYPILNINLKSNDLLLIIFYHIWFWENAINLVEHLNCEILMNFGGSKRKEQCYLYSYIKTHSERKKEFERNLVAPKSVKDNYGFWSVRNSWNSVKWLFVIIIIMLCE